jgi:hypothetical protein
MRAMRAQLHRSTIFDWLRAILARCADLMDNGAGRFADRERRREVDNDSSRESHSGAGTVGSAEESPWSDMGR